VVSAAARATHDAGMTEAIRVRGLRKRYGDRTVVDGLDFEVAWGACVALLGPNGAGKTTTVEILEGYRRRDAGEVRVCGADPGTAGRAWRAQLGIMPQDSRPSDELTVTELVSQFASYYPDPRGAGEVIELVGLGPQAAQRCKRLSGGQQRRLDVALALVGRPRLLFLDEPTTGFDPEVRRQFWALLRALHRDGTTVLLTTHYLDEAAQLADRVIVIAAGRVVADAAPDQLGDRHLAAATVSWTEQGTAQHATTDAPTALITALAGRLGGEVPDLVVHRRSLEEAYLALVGGPS
jgi:ABC-2 type transport system ATP-binding protein